MKNAAEKTAPKRAILSIGEDMSMMVAAGDQALEVHLDSPMALGLVQEILRNVAALKPWSGHAEEALIAALHDLAFQAGRLSLKLQSPGRSVDDGMCDGAHTHVQRVSVLLALIGDVLHDKEKDRNAHRAH